LLKNISISLFNNGIDPYIDASDRIIPPVKDTIIIGLQGITWRNDSSGCMTEDRPREPIVRLAPCAFFCAKDDVTQELPSKKIKYKTQALALTFS